MKQEEVKANEQQTHVPQQQRAPQQYQSQGISQLSYKSPKKDIRSQLLEDDIENNNQGGLINMG